MKTKTRFLQKTMTILSVFVIFISSTAFLNTEKVIETQSQGYYFFLEFQPGSTSDYSDKRYISGVLYYEGYEICGNDYDFKPKAQRAFENYIKANYNESYLRHTMTYSTKLNSTDKIKTSQQAREVVEKYIADQKAKGKNVIQTPFTYSCN